MSDAVTSFQNREGAQVLESSRAALQPVAMESQAGPPGHGETPVKLGKTMGIFSNSPPRMQEEETLELQFDPIGLSQEIPMQRPSHTENEVIQSQTLVGYAFPRIPQAGDE